MSYYLRALFTVYWKDMQPSATVMYFEAYELNHTCSSIARMERFVQERLRVYAGWLRPLQVIFTGGFTLVMTPEDISVNGWTVIPATQFTPYVWGQDRAPQMAQEASAHPTLSLAPQVPVEAVVPHQASVMDVLYGKV